MLSPTYPSIALEPQSKLGFPRLAWAVSHRIIFEKKVGSRYPSIRIVNSVDTSTIRQEIIRLDTKILDDQT